MKNLLPLELLLPLHRDYRRDVKFGILGRWGPIVSCRQPLDSSRSDGVSISGLESPRDHIKSSSDNIVNSMDTARERETKTGTESRSGSYKRPKLQIWQDAACGAVAGLSSRLVVAPLDVIKIRLQIQFSHEKYTSIRQTVATIMREESLRGFWKGNLSASYMYVIYGTSQFAIFNVLDRAIPSTFLCGAIAGSVATALTYPFDTLRTRFAAAGSINSLPLAEQKTYPFRSLSAAIRHIYLVEGVKGFYRGLSAAIMQIFPYMGLTFSTYNFFYPIYADIPFLRDHGYDAFFSGATSGLVSKFFVMPLDTTRRRLQVQGPLRTSYVVVPQSYDSMWHCISKMTREEGVRSLWKGTVPGLVKAVPNAAVTFAVLEWARNFFHLRREPAE